MLLFTSFSYGSPFIYRPPEAETRPCSLTFVEGFKFDVWTLGTLTIELFTKQSIYSAAKRNNSSMNVWAKHMYSLIFDIIQVRQVGFI